MTKQRTYRIRNWKEYNRSLINRGNITIWFSEEALDKWGAEKTGARGRPRIYSDEAILCALVVKVVYHLSLRSLQGFLTSLICLFGLPLSVPSYCQICRRAAFLGATLKRLSGNRRITDIVIDSTGLKVYGEGEWKVRTHGKSKRRTWRKAHLAICPDSHMVSLALLTDNATTDSEAFEEMTHYLPRSVKRAYGDGAYDRSGSYKKSRDRGILLIAPPQNGAVVHNVAAEPWMSDRNEAIRVIAGLGNDDTARSLWKKLMGYHRRSLAETGMFRFKALFGGALSSRELSRQRAEFLAKATAMNRMTSLGMPKGVWLDNGDQRLVI